MQTFLVYVRVRMRRKRMEKLYSNVSYTSCFVLKVPLYIYTHTHTSADSVMVSLGDLLPPTKLIARLMYTFFGGRTRAAFAY